MTSSGIDWPAMGVGVWSWGDRLTWGYGRGYGKDDVHAAYEASLAAGLSFFDTAEIYGFGRSESLLGEFLRQHRDGALVATKFFPFPWRLRPGNLILALRSSLRRLGLPSVDLYQIHWPFPPVPTRVWAEALADAVRMGLTRTVGVSNYGLALTRQTNRSLADHGIPLASNQIEFSLLDRTPERTGLLDTCHELGVKVIAYSPLAMGLLTGKYSSARRPPPSRLRSFRRVDLDRLPTLVAALREVGQAHGDRTAGQVALNWVVTKGAVPIPGAKNAAQATENAGAVGWSLSTEESRHLEQVADTVVRR
jgi:aryl-alcohol dehydrogenase-like predicted oxidoreductase